MKTLAGLLQGHPDMARTPGMEAVTGSLGQGLSIGVGMALALRLDGRPSRVYVIMGNGELSEGQLWEAAMAARRFGVDNLTAIVDRNRVQATGPTKENDSARPELVAMNFSSSVAGSLGGLLPTWEVHMELGRLKTER